VGKLTSAVMLADAPEVAESSVSPSEGPQKPARLPPVLVVQPDGVQVCGCCQG